MREGIFERRKPLGEVGDGLSLGAHEPHLRSESKNIPAPTGLESLTSIPEARGEIFDLLDEDDVVRPRLFGNRPLPNLGAVRFRGQLGHRRWPFLSRGGAAFQFGHRQWPNYVVGCNTARLGNRRFPFHRQPHFWPPAVSEFLRRRNSPIRTPPVSELKAIRDTPSRNCIMWRIFRSEKPFAAPGRRAAPERFTAAG
jgi:hypothetical protein